MAQRNRVEGLTRTRKWLEDTGRLKMPCEGMVEQVDAGPSNQPKKLSTARSPHAVLGIVVAYCNGQGIPRIAADLHISEVDVMSTLRGAGVTLRDKKRNRDEARDQAQLLRGQGLSFREIGRRIGIAHTTVRRLLA